MFWLRISCETDAARTASSEGSDKAGGASSMAAPFHGSSVPRLLTGGLSSSSQGPLRITTWAPSQHGGWLPPDGVIQKQEHRAFPDGPVVKNLLTNARDIGSSPSQRTKIPYAAEQLRR